VEHIRFDCTTESVCVIYNAVRVNFCDLLGFLKMTSRSRELEHILSTMEFAKEEVIEVINAIGSLRRLRTITREILRERVVLWLEILNLKVWSNSVSPPVSTAGEC